MIPVLYLITLFVFFWSDSYQVIRRRSCLVNGRRPSGSLVEQNAETRWSVLGAIHRVHAQSRPGGSRANQFDVESLCAISCSIGFRPTIFFSLYAMILSVVITVPLATWAAFREGKLVDQFVRVFVVLSLGMPTYWVAMMLLQFFAVQHRIFPVSGYGDGFFGHLESLFLPAFGLALTVSSLMVRSLRNSILETLEAD